MSIPSHTAQIFCTTFFGLCAYPPITPYTVPFPSPKPATTRPAPSGQAPLQIVHFSDIHVDQFYETGASYNCTKPICCRNYIAADAPGNNNYPAGPFGNPLCDAPVGLEQSMYAAIASIAPDAALTLFTGDIVDHAVWLVTEPQNLLDINDAISRMSGLNNVLGTLGNHESAPVNFYPPKALDITGTSSQQWLYNAVSSGWEHWIGGDAAAQVQDFGAYSTLVGNLRVISLNTNLWYIENFYLYEPTIETDPSGQLAWLVTELQAAETAGERVYIIGHMPLGLSDAFRDASNYFDQIVNRYSATIAALFFGNKYLFHRSPSLITDSENHRTYTHRPIRARLQQLHLPNLPIRPPNLLHLPFDDSNLWTSRLQSLLRRSRHLRRPRFHDLHRQHLRAFFPNCTRMGRILLCKIDVRASCLSSADGSCGGAHTGVLA